MTLTVYCDITRTMQLHGPQTHSTFRTAQMLAGCILGGVSGQGSFKAAVSKMQRHGSQDSLPKGRGARVMVHSWPGNGEQKLALRSGVFMWGQVGDCLS